MILLLACVVLFVAWLAPGHFRPWVSFQNEAAAAAGGLLLAVFAVITAKREDGVYWPLPAIEPLGCGQSGGRDAGGEQNRKQTCDEVLRAIPFPATPR